MKTSNNLIIGAGITGLTVAEKLKESGLPFLVVEKSKGVGGRMATRRDADVTYDHGAQFYKSSSNFLLDNHWSSAGLTKIWFEKDGIVNKAAIGGMTSLAKHITHKDKLVLNIKIEKINSIVGEWVAINQDGIEFFCEQIFLTCPLPQSLEILRNSQISYPEHLDKIQYAKSLVGLFEVDSDDIFINTISYEENIGESIFSISNQKSKGLSSRLAFTVVMNPAWSENNFEENESKNINSISSIFSNYLNSKGKNTIRKASLKKWRYSYPVLKASEPFIEVKPGLYLLGDAFGGPTIEGAYQSAMNLISHLEKKEG